MEVEGDAPVPGEQVGNGILDGDVLVRGGAVVREDGLDDEAVVELHAEGLGEDGAVGGLREEWEWLACQGRDEEEPDSPLGRAVVPGLKQAEPDLVPRDGIVRTCASGKGGWLTSCSPGRARGT